MVVRPPPHGWRCFLLLSSRGRCCCGRCCFALLSPLVWRWFLHPPLVLLAFSLPLVRGAVFSSSFSVVQFFCLSLVGGVACPLPPFFVVLLSSASLRCCCRSPLKLNWTPQTQQKKRKWTFWGEGEKIVASFLFIFNCSSFSVSYFCWLVDLWEGL